MRAFHLNHQFVDDVFMARYLDDARVYVPLFGGR